MLLEPETAPIFKDNPKGELNDEGVAGVAAPLLGVFAPDDAAEDDCVFAVSS